MSDKFSKTNILTYISLGSNSGDSRKNLKSALEALSALPGVRLLGESPVYRTEPQEDPAQPWFFNQVAALESGLAPHELLEKLQEIENSLGRERDPQRRFGPRSIDLDLLYMHGVTLEGERLSLPHPRMWGRAFVLVPLLDVADAALRARVEGALAGLGYRLDNDKIYQNG